MRLCACVEKNLLTLHLTTNDGGFAKALDYTLKRWPSLIRYAESGHLPIDNNPMANVIRPIALGGELGLLTIYRYAESFSATKINSEDRVICVVKYGVHMIKLRVDLHSIAV
ncbi:Transposase IS66 family protein [Nitrosomonas sp. Nm33]|nr:Transposase IS66 family protein [Nitrosomonas sp. Nm33]